MAKETAFWAMQAIRNAVAKTGCEVLVDHERMLLLGRDNDPEQVLDDLGLMLGKVDEWPSAPGWAPVVYKSDASKAAGAYRKTTFCAVAVLWVLSEAS